MNSSATSTSSAGRHRRPASAAGRMHRRGLRLVIGLLVIFMVLAAPAMGYWRSTGSGAGSAATATLTAPTSVTVGSISLPNVAVSWTASISSPAPTGYYVTRKNAGVTVAACATSPTVTTAGTTCTDTAVPSGSYTYTVTAVYRSWTSASSASGTVVVWTPSMAAFTIQPANTVAGSAITASVAVQNASGTAVPVAGIAVVVSIGTNPGGGTLSGTLTSSTNASGVASFAGLSINKAAAGYTLAAASTGLTTATSSTFTISAAAASKFAITSTAVSGAAVATATLGPITVQEQDVFGNPVLAAAGGTAVTLSSNSTGTRIFSSTSGGASTTTSTIAAGSSVATFFYGDTKAGSPTITVSGSLTSATQVETITAGAAALLVFGQQPTSAATSHTITPAVTALVEDQFGNLTTSTVNVTIAIANNAGGLLPGFLYGTKTVAAIAGTATFSGLSIDGVVLGLGGNGNGYTLKVTSGALTSATSTAFNIT